MAVQTLAERQNQITLRVLLVEDDTFTRQLVEGALRQQNFQVFTCADASTAMELVALNEPHVVVSDLDLGRGANGADLLSVIHRDFPWVGLVVLTAHAAPKLASSGLLPAGIPYLVKSSIADLIEIGAAIRRSITNIPPTKEPQPEESVVVDCDYLVSPAQAETLRLLALGHSNLKIAALRGTTLRAAETMIQRTYKALGLSAGSQQNNRVEAANLWRQGRVRVR